MAQKNSRIKKVFDSTPYIVGIGASAGGLDAINDFFENMPENTGFSYVIIQHLSPDHKSMMTDLISKHTLMPAVEAEDGMAVKANCIYTIPNKKFMTIRDGRLHLTEKVKTKMPNNAIDIFFESLAKNSTSHAVGVILSGSGSDGTRGIEVIKNSGGIVMVQDPMTAAFDSMPNSAVATGKADLIIPPDMMGEELLNFLNESPVVRSFHAQNEKAEEAITEILDKIRDTTGIDFGYYKKPTLYRRLAKRMSELGITDVAEYVTYLTLHYEEVSVLTAEFLINVSSFFRDKEAFNILRTQVVPAIFNDKKPTEPVKVWSIACSTGEEAYSLAILLREYLDKNRITDFNVKIFATDIDKHALEIASRGIYPKSILQDVPGDLLAKHFVPEGNAYRIHPDVRKMVVFSYHDVLKDPPFSKMDLVTCRNMLIYINPAQQKEILKKLHFSLNINGFLFLGPSENVGPMKASVQEIDKKWKIYRCNTKRRLNDPDELFSPVFKSHLEAITSRSKIKNALQHIPDLFNETLLSEFRFTGILIGEDFEVKQATGKYKDFLDFPESGFNFNITRLVKPDLGIALSIAIRKALKTNVPVTMRDVKVHEDDRVRNVNIVVKPYLRKDEYMQSFLFVLLSESSGEQPATGTVAAEPGGSMEEMERVAELEKELNETRANLQAVIEEVETTNEELQSANEELISANEELQSTNEELQSLNEELHTMNAEHQQKIKELTDLNDDMNNYFRNSDIGQIILDGSLIIRKFTPAVTKMVNLIESDINRSISDITNRIRNVDLLRDIREVMRTEAPLEKEIMLENNAVYLMRISPYLRQNNRIDGVVVNFIDVTEVKNLSSVVEAIFNSSQNGITSAKPVRNKKSEIIDFEYTAANSAAEKMLGVAKGGLTGLMIRKNFGEAGDKFFNAFKKVIETGESFHHEFYMRKSASWFDVTSVKMNDGVVTTYYDVTEKKKAADELNRSYEALKLSSSQLASSNMELEKSNLDLMQFASVASHDLKEPLRKIETFGNMLREKMAGYAENGEISYLDKIIRSSGRMKVLIEDVLTLSKLSNSDQSYSRVDLANIVHRVKEDLEITIAEKEAEINVDPLPEINAIPGQIRQLFQNLLSNALKFNNHKPIINIRQIEIDETTAKGLKIDPADYTCISVSDNGIGFEPQFSEKIFGIFQRLNGSMYDGTGIGLAICKKIADNHQGFIIASSTLGEGSEFRVLLKSQ